MNVKIARNSYSLPKFPTNRLQHIQNALARTVVQAPKFQHITAILRTLHWLKVSERIEYKIISLTYKIRNITQPSYLYELIAIQPPHGHNTRSGPIFMKLDTYNYFPNTTELAKFQGPMSTWVVWANSQFDA